MNRERRSETIEPTTAERDRTYWSISEVAELTDVKPHVLRYWETQFPMLRPKKGRSGSRRYRRADLELVRRIRCLLYEKGFTLKGARRRLRLEQRSDPGENQLGLGIDNPWHVGLTEIREELISLQRELTAGMRIRRPGRDSKG
ncbi:MAG: MerR family transcriptional regulator [Candidatus Eisenbacteria bacterium]|nr:MerR family transcriptional regulator [Candidatus Latescibacterota bacterium]MBD3301248.1 MerR family transcriptional regulator [Candidatus Eisenbacteria bacterium]